MILPFKDLVLFKVKEWCESGKSCNHVDREDTGSLDDADVVSSLRRGGGHMIVLDIDAPAALIESTTPGHHHLYIDVDVPWTKYRMLLLALAEAGVIEEGYAAASVRRGYSSVRMPWVRKAAE